MTMQTTTQRASSFVPLSLLWLAGNSSRLTILAIPPILALIIQDLGLSGTDVGILNAIPAALFALVAVPGSLLIARVGAVRALVVGLLVVAVGSALRGFAMDTLVLYSATVLMSAGVAVMQPAQPPLVSEWVPRRIGFATAIYTNGLLCGEILPVVLAGTLLALLGGSWRGSLVAWSIVPAVVAVVVILAQPRREAHRVSTGRRWMPDWSDPLLWKVGLALSANNQLYFCVNAFLPGLLLQNGQSDLIGLALSALNMGQLPGSLLLLAMASRLERKKWPLIGAGMLGLLALAGLSLTASPWTIVISAALVGFSCSIGLTLLLTLPALLVESDEVPAMSAGVFAIGYGIPVMVSLIAGMLWDFTGNAAFAFLPIAVALLPIIIFTLAIDLSKQRFQTAY